MRVIGYMITWTVYGSWLQGDRRGWVKKGKIYDKNIALEDFNRRQMKANQVILTKKQRMSAADAITKKSAELKQKLFALTVCDNHIHLVVQNINMSIGRIVSHYKHAARFVLQEQGFQGKLWTRGFDKRYCMNQQELTTKITYIRNHINTNAEIIINNT